MGSIPDKPMMYFIIILVTKFIFIKKKIYNASVISISLTVNRNSTDMFFSI